MLTTKPRTGPCFYTKFRTRPHIRDGRFDSMREYINPSGAGMSMLLGLVLRTYPLLARWRARGAAAS